MKNQLHTLHKKIKTLGVLNDLVRVEVGTVHINMRLIMFANANLNSR